MGDQVPLHLREELYADDVVEFLKQAEQDPLAELEFGKPAKIPAEVESIHVPDPDNPGTWSDIVFVRRGEKWVRQ